MAIYRPGAIVSAISGKLGGQVFVNGASGSVLRHRPAGARTPAASQQTARRNIAQVQRAWSGLTTADQLTWRNYATQFPVRTRLGEQRPLSGFQAYVRYNLYQLAFGNALADYPSKRSTNAIPDTFELAVSSGGVITVTLTAATSGLNVYALLYGAISYSPSQPRSMYRWKFLAPFTRTAGGIDIITTTWGALLPAPQTGQWIAVRALAFSEDWTPVVDWIRTQVRP